LTWVNTPTLYSEDRRSTNYSTDTVNMDIKDYERCLIKVIDSLERNCIFNYTNCVHDEEIMYNNSNMK